MQKARGQIGEVEAAIETALAHGRTGIEDVAQILFMSKSTLQRRLGSSSFTAVRQRVQLRLSLDALKSGREAGSVAKEVALSRDHLRILVKKTTSLTPARIAHAARLASRLQAWKEQVPPPSGTYAYRRRVDLWDQSDRKLQAMLGDIQSGNPLAPWAKQILPAVERPDNRLRSNRARIHEARRHERERREALRKQEEERHDKFLEESWAEVSPGLKSLFEVTP
jgi:AraC-like DNA-binding protein